MLAIHLQVCSLLCRWGCFFFKIRVSWVNFRLSGKLALKTLLIKGETKSLLSLVILTGILNDSLFGYLLHEGSLTNLWRLYVITHYTFWLLKKSAIRNLLYFGIWISNFFPTISLADLKYYFYVGFRINIKGFSFYEIKSDLIKSPSKSFDDDLLIIYPGMSSLEKRGIPPPLKFLSYLNGGIYLSVINSAFRKKQSSFDIKPWACYSLLY